VRKYDYVCSIRDKYVEIIYEYYKVLLGGYVLSNINLDINLEVEKKESRLIYNLSKRIIDIIGSLIGLILLSPILIIVGILIKFESKGPIVFTQKRVGKDGKEFDMYKLRSMVVNAEEIKEKLKEQNEMSGPMFKMKDDPRITKVGKFIRKTSIDELPQLVNVLKGDMSLVGPRPSLPNEVKEFETWMLKRLNVKPGLTCYWQVMGRNNIDFEDWMKLDVKYVNERSFWLDIKLIFKTFFVLFGDKNAA
jgi:exopolysaccharide biosynthesis polyprenyl glycosylphosphotransferase